MVFAPIDSRRQPLENLVCDESHQEVKRISPLALFLRRLLGVAPLQAFDPEQRGVAVSESFALLWVLFCKLTKRA